MAKIPKAATSGGSGKGKGASYPTAPTGKVSPTVRSPGARGGRSIGPTRCTAKGSRRTY
jgi:hypothetical protein